jgi:hypothetical protein
MRATTGLAISYDPRNLIYELGSLPPLSEEKKSKARLRHPVDARDQGQKVHCCVSVAITACMEILHAEASPADFTLQSVLFHYWVTRKTTSCFGDLTFEDGFHALREHGICARSKHLFPITPENARQRPSREAYDDAEARKSAQWWPRPWEYRKIEERDVVDAWLEVLRARRALAMGIWLTDAYERLSRTAGVHAVPLSPALQRVCHAVTVIGYDQGKLDAERLTKGAFLIKDSRGPGFCNGGCWWLPFKLVGRGLIYQSWTVMGMT